MRLPESKKRLKRGSKVYLTISCLDSVFVFLGLCIPANNTIFIVGISSNLASKEPHLTLEVMLDLVLNSRDHFDGNSTNYCCICL